MCVELVKLSTESLSLLENKGLKMCHVGSIGHIFLVKHCEFLEGMILTRLLLIGIRILPD